MNRPVFTKAQKEVLKMWQKEQSKTLLGDLYRKFDCTEDKQKKSIPNQKSKRIKQTYNFNPISQDIDMVRNLDYWD